MSDTTLNTSAEKGAVGSCGRLIAWFTSSGFTPLVSGRSVGFGR